MTAGAEKRMSRLNKSIFIMQKDVLSESFSKFEKELIRHDKLSRIKGGEWTKGATPPGDTMSGGKADDCYSDSWTEDGAIA